MSRADQAAKAAFDKAHRDATTEMTAQGRSPKVVASLAAHRATIAAQDARYHAEQGV